MSEVEDQGLVKIACFLSQAPGVTASYGWVQDPDVAAARLNYKLRRDGYCGLAYELSTPRALFFDFNRTGFSEEVVEEVEAFFKKVGVSDSFRVTTLRRLKRATT